MGWLGPALRGALARGELSLALTGAGSWLGNAFLALLANEGALPPPGRLRLFGAAARQIRLDEQTYSVEALVGAPPLARTRWLVLHFAFLGKERTADFAPGAFLETNDAILHETLRIVENAQDLRIVFASSGAVYGPDRQLVRGPAPDPYGWCKVLQEDALTRWARARGVPLVIPRIFNIGGPFANKLESYALTSFILAARRTGLIHIAARRPTYRSYVHVNELLGVTVEAVLAQRGDTPLIFDTAGAEIVEMQTLAERVQSILAPRPVAIMRPEGVSGEPSIYVGEGAPYRELLRAQARQPSPIDCIVRDTADFLYGPLFTTP